MGKGGRVAVSDPPSALEILPTSARCDISSNTTDMRVSRQRDTAARCSSLQRGSARLRLNAA